VGKGDTAWLSTNAEKLTEIAHDFANPLGSGDTRYCQNRSFDWFAGHAWASGLTPFADGENCESSSEAINGFYGLAFLGSVLGDTRMENQGLLMLASQIRIANKYYHIYAGNNVYTNPAYLNGGSYTGNGLGMIWSDKMVDQTWFSGYLSARRMIQMIPITPVSELYMPSAWINAMSSSGELSTCLSQVAVGQPNAGYACYIYAANAVIQAQSAAWISVTGLTSAQLDPNGNGNGQSMTNMMYWVATRA
jgi:endo-1,3(4)-beta-glucanase